MLECFSSSYFHPNKLVIGGFLTIWLACGPFACDQKKVCLSEYCQVFHLYLSLMGLHSRRYVYKKWLTASFLQCRCDPFRQNGYHVFRFVWTELLTKGIEDLLLIIKELGSSFELRSALFFSFLENPSNRAIYTSDPL